MHRVRDKKKRIFWLFLIIMLYSFFEVSSYFILSFLGKFRDIEYNPLLTNTIPDKHRQILNNLLKNNTQYLAHSSILGWTIKKNGSSPLYQANSQGIRASREFQLKASPNVIRISTFGDSYTHCDDVGNEDTWQEKLINMNSSLEVINFGVEGFGLDQSFLRYQQDGIPYNSHIVLIGFMSENIARNVSVYRPFYYPSTGVPLTKPYFSINHDKLILHKNPLQTISQIENLLVHPEILLPQFGLNDHHFQRRYKRGRLDILPSVRLFKVLWYRFVKDSDPSWKWCYDEDSEAFKITVQIFEKFYSSVIQNDSLPIIVIFPNEFDILKYRKDRTKIYSPLLAYFKDQKYRYLDLVDAFEKDNKFEIDKLIKSHYTPQANELVAKYILEYLKKEELENPEKAKDQIRLLKTQNR